MRLGIDIGVGGRFHADHLATALLDLGHDVRVWSTYPRSRFPTLNPHSYQSVLWPELIYRGLKKIGAENMGDLTKMRWFGRTLARKLSHSSRRDVFVGWSSFSLETLRTHHHTQRAVIRDSAHMRRQLDILREAYGQFGVALPDRTAALEREENEYGLADTIFVLSRFAWKSFVEQGVDERKLRLLPLGVDTRLFKPIAKDRVRLPLKVVYFGSVSVRKGVSHLLAATAAFDPKEIELTVIGPIESALRPLVSKFSSVKWRGSMPQKDLAALLPTFDLFVMPTLEDGFGQTLVQAMACGLVPISTDRCGAAEHLVDGKNGRVVAAGNAGALRDALAEYVTSPDQILNVRQESLKTGRNLNWSRYAQAIGSWLAEAKSK